MKLKDLLIGSSALAVMSLVSTSCTSEMVTPYPGGEPSGKPSMLVHAPDIYAWSGTQDLGSSRAARSRSRADGITFERVETTLLDKDKEEKIIEEYLPEQNENLNDNITRNFLFKADKDLTFELYPVYCQTNTAKTVGIFYYDTKGNYGEVQNLFEGITQHQGRFEESWGWDNDLEQSVKHTKYIGKKVSIPAGYVFGFFWNGNNNQGATTYYSIESWNDECFETTGGGQKIEPEKRSKLHGVTFELEGKTYLGLEDWTDFDFQDLVFTCPEDLVEVPIDDIPEKGEPWTGDTFPGGDDNEDPGTPEPTDPKDPEDDLCDDCHHKHQPGENCDECKDQNGDGDHGPCYTDPNGGNNGGGTTTPEPDPTPGPTPNPNPDNDYVVTHNDEVEVNFSINDVHNDANGQKYENADLWTKLSIHVRKGTDVEIFVPLDGKYLCESDDFAIFQDHMNGHDIPGYFTEDGIYNHTMQYTIVDGDNDRSWTVTLTVNIDLNGMTIKTNGIDQDLIDYLFEQNGDGINFEIWNYFQTETVDWINGEKHITPTLGEEDYGLFQETLNRSTIKFLDDDPSFYINAFGFDWNNGVFSNEIRPRDCLVTPVDESKFDMFEYFAYHLNGTPYNIIWSRTDVDKKSDDYLEHTVTPENPKRVNLYDEK